MRGKCKRTTVYRCLVAGGTAFVLLYGCGTGDKPVRTVRPLEVDARIARLDQDLFREAGAGDGTFTLKLYAEHGDFFRIYVENILHATAFDDPRLPIVLEQFARDPEWIAVQQRVDSLFGDMTREEAAFGRAFGRLKAFFPDSLVPRLVAYNSGFNYGVFPTDSVLGFGVEWFVGKDSPVVRYLAPEMFPQYRKDRMIPEMLVPSVVKGWLQVHYARDTRGEDLLQNLVEMGKVMALLDAVMPEAAEHLRFAFTPEQMEWCRASEFNIWREIIGKELLYSKDRTTVDRFMDDGPFTSGFPRESPGHIGEWIGYRMVAAYMRAHPEATFADVFAMDDPQAILKTYKPR